MKKSWILLSVMVLAVGLVGCSNKEEPAEVPDEVDNLTESNSSDFDQEMQAEYTKYEDEEAIPWVYMANETGSFIILKENHEGFVDWTDTQVLENYRGPVTWEAGKIILTEQDNKEINYAVYMHSHNGDEYSVLVRNDDKSAEIRFMTAYDELPQALADEISADGYDKYLEDLLIY